jgi:outer membrane protein
LETSQVTLSNQFNSPLAARSKSRIARLGLTVNSKEITLRYFLSTIAALALSFGIVAVEAAEIKIGFIDAERINRESAPAERASKQLEKEFAPRAQELQRREAQMKTLQGQLEKDTMTMSESDRRAKEQELARMNLDFQRLQREYREDLNLRRNQELSTLFERANRVIKQIAEAEKYDLILQEAVYRNPRIDITDKVLKALAEGK